jgi:hypothetical protein
MDSLQPTDPALELATQIGRESNPVVKLGRLRDVLAGLGETLVTVGLDPETDDAYLQIRAAIETLNSKVRYEQRRELRGFAIVATRKIVDGFARARRCDSRHRRVSSSASTRRRGSRRCSSGTRAGPEPGDPDPGDESALPPVAGEQQGGHA